MIKLEKKEIKKKGFGTKEWADSNINIYFGCSNNCKYCLSEDTKILMNDSKEKRIRDVRIGEKIVGLKKGKQNMEYTEAKILNKWGTFKEAYKIRLEDGTVLICSGDHRWYTERGWKFTNGETCGMNRRPHLTLNNNIKKLYNSLNLDFKASEDFKKGYLSGMINGDGLLKKFDYSNRKREHIVNEKKYIRKTDIHHHFRLVVRDIECLLRTKKYLSDFNIETSKVYPFYPLKKDYMQAIRTSKKTDFYNITKLIEPKDTNEFYRGFVSGFYDAEGNVDTSHKTSMRISNKKIELIELYEKGLRIHDFSFKREMYREGLFAVRLVGGRHEKIRFIQTFNPSIRTMKLNAWKGSIKNLYSSIVEIIPLNKKMKMIDIETTTGNFIANGCVSHNCYAKMMAIRFERKTEDNWVEMILNRKAVIKDYKKRKGRIMFPTSHDITTESLEYSVIVLRKILKAGNEVLITTKPNLWCIYELLNRLEEFKSQIQFRFTITSINDQKLRFWEPNAPNYEERLLSLQLAKYRGFKTSISIEPYLDADPIKLIKTLYPHCTGSIWIGKMNYIKAKGILPSEKNFYDFQRKISSWYSIQKIISNLKKLPDEIKSKIKIKDSIRNLCAKKGVVLKK